MIRNMDVCVLCNQNFKKIKRGYTKRRVTQRVDSLRHFSILDVLKQLYDYQVQ